MVDNESSATAIKGGILADDMGLGKTVTGAWTPSQIPKSLTVHSCHLPDTSDRALPRTPPRAAKADAGGLHAVHPQPMYAFATHLHSFIHSFILHSFVCPICRAGLDEITTRIAKRKAARVLTYYGSGRSQSKELVESYDIGTRQMHLSSLLSFSVSDTSALPAVLTTYGTLAAEFKGKGTDAKAKTAAKPSLLASIHWWRVVLDEGKTTRVRWCASACAVMCRRECLLAPIRFFFISVTRSPLDQEQEDQDGHGRPPAAGRAALVSQRHPHSKQVSTQYWTLGPTPRRSHSCVDVNAASTICTVCCASCTFPS
jgi:hypothetical protein